MDYLLEKGECNRFDEHQIDALEQFCFALYENTELDKPMERIEELEKDTRRQQRIVDSRGKAINEMSQMLSQAQRELSDLKESIKPKRKYDPIWDGGGR
jgi:archaellum component FlaC